MVILAICSILIYSGLLVFFVIYQLRIIALIAKIELTEDNIKALYSFVARRFINLLIISFTTLMIMLVFFLSSIIRAGGLPVLFILLAIGSGLLFLLVNVFLNSRYYRYLKSIWLDFNGNHLLLLLVGILNGISLTLLLLGVFGAFI